MQVNICLFSIMTELFLTNDFIFVDIGHFFNLNLGGFFRDLLYGEGDGGGILLPCLKVVRTML